MFPQPPESLPKKLYESLVSALGMVDNPLFESFDNLHDPGTQHILRSAANTYFNAVKHALWTANTPEGE